jgi:hypothetical protein
MVLRYAFSSGGIFMQTSTPLTAQQARRIARHQGLIFGISAGILILLVTAFTHFLSESRTITLVIYLLVLLAFIGAGMRTTTKTHRIDMGARAGFWAAVAVALFFVASVVLDVDQSRASMSRSAMLSSVLASLPLGLIVLIVGATVGMLGGVLSTTSAEDVVSPPPTSTQPASSPALPLQSSPSATQSAAAAPVQPMQSSPPLDDQA